MNICATKQALLNGVFKDKLELLYADVNSETSRYINACDKFTDLFGAEREVELFSAPGRTEIGGNHTDHQLGCVLAASVNLDVIAVVSKNDDMIVRIKSEGFDIDTVDLNIVSPQEDELHSSAALIRGMCIGMNNLGYKIGGFDAYTTSNILKGSGLSSSAAFEVLIGSIINGLYNDGCIDAVAIAKVGQYAENEFFGKPCGLMDQLACSVGGFVAIDFADKQNPVINKLDFDLASTDYTLCIVNTGDNHSDLTDEFSAITNEMGAISNHFGVTCLREVAESDFYDSIVTLRRLYGDRAVLRAMHFFDDNRRVAAQRDALSEGNFNKFLKIVKDSGNSSFFKLQNAYSYANIKEQGVTVALAISEKVLGDNGAFRLHGGGFGGTIQAYVPNDLLNAYKSSIERVFGHSSCYNLNIRAVGGIKIS